MLGRLLPFAALLLVAAHAAAQDAPAGDGDGAIRVPVVGGIQLFQMAVPDAANLGDVPDKGLVSDAFYGTIIRSLQISGYFNLIDKSAYLVDSAKEGMNPDYKAWFNIGTQGLIKIGYRIVGNEVTADLRLYSIDGSQRVSLPAPYQQPATLPLEQGKLRRHAQGFVNEVIRYFTKSPGFFDSRIVCVKRVGKNKELFQVSPDGLEEVQLTRAGGLNMLPTLRGNRIFFTSYRNGGAHLFVLSGGTTKPYASYQGLNTGADLSPNGSAVAATLSRDGNPEIYLLDPSSGAIKSRLTNSWGIDTSPTFSPDGRQIAFVSDRHGSPQIWLMSADGGNQRRLTFHGDYNQTPDWNPRGDKIIFTARDERFVFDLFTVDVGTGQVERLTQNQGNNEEPSWSPDGRHFVFTSTRSGSAQLYISTADGRFQTQISTNKGEYLTPSWGR